MKLSTIVFVVFSLIYLSGCSNGAGISGISRPGSMNTSSVVRVSVLAGDPLPQVANSPRSVNTGRLKIYVMDEENPYRENIVQEVDMNYRVPSKAEGQRIRVASLAKKPVVKPARYRSPAVKKTRVIKPAIPAVKKTRVIKPAIPAITEVKIPETPIVQRYVGSKSSTVVTLPSKKPLTQRPVSLQPKQKESVALRDYKEVLKKLNTQKVAQYKPKKNIIKKRGKKRVYNYYKGGAKNKKPTLKRKKKKKNKNKNKRKSKWKWDSKGRLLRVSA